LPNGVLKENVLIFPINNMGLCGAFFPQSGIPEMPKATASSSIPPAIFNLIAQLPPDQRNSIIMQIKQRLAAGQDPRPLFEALIQRGRQQLQSRTAMANHFALNSNIPQLGAMGNGMNMMNMNSMNANGMNPFGAMANPPAMLSNMNRTATGSGSGTSMNLNYDVLQSFMQRNHPDGNNNSSGMGLG
jgi:mediator of RNA polymerase II transcription subunit 25